MVDALDLKIINQLKENARESYVEIGKKIGLSPSSVRERVQKLEDAEIIEGYSLKLNHKNMGFGLEVLISFKVFSGKLKVFCDVLKQYEEICQMYRITGTHNIFMKVILKDQSHLEQFIDSIIVYGEPTTHLILSDLGA